ncbi:MAG: hypothetical protein KatS3mg111_4181 [Pirellulaceae bacterium]|nr:MAG: hypothetical protein KatS3mg111_4181 [Pirellulaceae bacterium]
MSDHWKQLAKMLGAPVPEDVEPSEQASSSTDGEENSTRAEAPSQQPFTSAPPTAVEASASGDQPGTSAGTKSTLAAISSSATAGTSGKRKKVKPKRSNKRSTWDFLASMLGVSSDAPSGQESGAPSAAADQPSSVAAVEIEQAGADTATESGGTTPVPESTVPAPVAELFERASEPVNPALESMFAEVPKRSLDEASSPQRIIDDVGDEESNWGESDITDELEDDAGGPGRRRGRRGRRRRRGEIVERESRDEALANASKSSDEVDDADSLLESAAEDEDAMPLRRSDRRRRRRGSRWSPEVAEGTSAEERGDDEVAMEVEIEQSAEVEVAWSEGDPSEPEAPTKRRRRRRRGRRREEEGSASSTGHVGETEGDADDELHSSEEDSHAATPRHKNIPSWEEALQPIIATNLDNHSKQENRGGRGRGRGRR